MKRIGRPSNKRIRKRQPNTEDAVGEAKEKEAGNWEWQEERGHEWQEDRGPRMARREGPRAGNFTGATDLATATSATSATPK